MHVSMVAPLLLIAIVCGSHVSALPVLYDDVDNTPATPVATSTAAAASAEQRALIIAHMHDLFGRFLEEQWPAAEAGDARSAEKRDPKRVSYHFGGHRTSGSSGVKRLPMYNFGLGKRGDKEMQTLAQAMEMRRAPYSFGLGKRSSPPVWNWPAPQQPFDADEQDDYVEQVAPEYLEFAPHYYGNTQYDYSVAPKRAPARPYGFGLGKRLEMDRRSAPQRYNFGLGR